MADDGSTPPPVPPLRRRPPPPPPPRSSSPPLSPSRMAEEGEYLTIPTKGKNTQGVLPQRRRPTHQVPTPDALLMTPHPRRFHLLGPDDDLDGDESCPFGDPFLKDGSGNMTKHRLSDVKSDIIQLREDEASEWPGLKEFSKKENNQFYDSQMKQCATAALHTYNNEKKLDEENWFEFEELTRENFIVEENFKQFYRHLNFTAKQPGSTSCLFFAEVVPSGGNNCEVICCKLLDYNENGSCFGCKNEGLVDLRHPSCDNMFIGGHEDCVFPFMVDSDSEDDSV